MGACHVVSLATLASLIQGCSGSSTEPSHDVPQLPTTGGTPASATTIVLTIDASSPLFAVGSAALVSSSLGSFLVAHTGASTFVALGSTCTHAACTVTGIENGLYTCPCHGSQFNTSGTVVSGPATVPLTQKTTQFVGNQLTITV